MNKSPVGSGEVTSLYFAEDYVDCWYDHANNIIITTWFNFSSRKHYRGSYTAKLEAARKFKPRGFIIDTNKAHGIPHPEDQQWTLDHIIPEARKLNFDFIVNVFPRNALSKTGVKIMIDMGKSMDLQVYALDSLEEAIDFIQDRGRVAENSELGILN